jgi:hypothetical protein
VSAAIGCVERAEPGNGRREGRPSKRGVRRSKRSARPTFRRMAVFGAIRPFKREDEAVDWLVS